MLHVSGKTTSGGFVIAGVYVAYATHGIPLDVLVSEISRRGHTIDWIEYVTCAVESGIPRSRACGRAIEACSDALGIEHAAEVKRRFEILKWL